MALQTVSAVGALSESAQLWIVPDLDHSSWSRWLDWYLNFLVTKAKFHKSLDIQTPFKSLLTSHSLKVDWHPETIPNSSLIPSSNCFPNRWCCIVDYTKKPQEWIGGIFQTWNNLERPTMRVFLPKEFSSESFIKHWPSEAAEFDISLVEDSAAPAI